MTELGNLGYVNLERYPVYLRTKSGSYYIELQAKDETRQIYYRYRLDREAVKYDDRGVDWTVLKDNRFDHHNVTVRVYTEQPAKKFIRICLRSLKRQLDGNKQSLDQIRKCAITRRG